MQADGHAQRLEDARLRVNDLPRQQVPQGRSQSVSRLEKGHSVAFEPEVQRSGKAGETASHDGHALLLVRQRGAASCDAASLHHCPFQLAYRDRSPCLASPAYLLAGVVTDTAHYTGKGHNGGKDLESFVPGPCRHLLQKRPHIHVDWTAGRTGRGLFLNASVF